MTKYINVETMTMTKVCTIKKIKKNDEMSCLWFSVNSLRHIQLNLLDIYRSNLCLSLILH